MTPILPIDILAATLHHRFGAAVAFRAHRHDYLLAGAERTLPLDEAIDPFPAAEAVDDGRVCPTCEGDCTVPACTDPACGCDMDPPCAERACPTCGGIGSV